MVIYTTFFYDRWFSHTILYVHKLCTQAVAYTTYFELGSLCSHLLRQTRAFSRRKYITSLSSLIHLNRAGHRNNELFLSCFRYCLAYSHPSKVNLPLLPEKTRKGKQNWLEKLFNDPHKKSRNRVPSNLAARQQNNRLCLNPKFTNFG